MASELRFVETDTLIKELQTRMDSMILMACRNRSVEQDAVIYGATGSLHECLGLLEMARIMVLTGGPENEKETGD